MLTLWGRPHPLWNDVSRRSYFTLGTLGVGGLTLTDILRARAASDEKKSPRSVIMVYHPAGHAMFAGGDFKMGQMIGDTGPRGERERGRATPYTPANVLATLYRFLDIDQATTVPDFAGRPIYLLDDREPIDEML